MTMTNHKLTAGDGYQYLIRQVAAVDTTARGRAPLIDYYSAKGESPGRWVGSGLQALSSTRARWVPPDDVDKVWAVPAGSAVAEAQMKALFGEGLHPNADAISEYVTARGVHGVAAAEATKLGRRFHIRDGETTFARALAVAYRNHNEEAGLHWNAPIAAPTRAAIRTSLAREKFAEQYGRAPADDRELSGFIARASRGRTTAVAGYDFTYSPVKSVSALWAIAPLDVAVIADLAEHAADNRAGLILIDTTPTGETWPPTPSARLLGLLQAELPWSLTLVREPVIPRSHHIHPPDRNPVLTQTRRLAPHLLTDDLGDAVARGARIRAINTAAYQRHLNVTWLRQHHTPAHQTPETGINLADD